MFNWLWLIPVLSIISFYECGREREAVEAHGIEHAQGSLLLCVVLLVRVEVHFLQLCP